MAVAPHPTAARADSASPSTLPGCLQRVPPKGSRLGALAGGPQVPQAAPPLGLVHAPVVVGVKHLQANGGGEGPRRRQALRSGSAAARPPCAAGTPYCMRPRQHIKVTCAQPSAKIKVKKQSTLTTPASMASSSTAPSSASDRSSSSLVRVPSCGVQSTCVRNVRGARVIFSCALLRMPQRLHVEHTSPHLPPPPLPGQNVDVECAVCEWQLAWLRSKSFRLNSSWPSPMAGRPSSAETPALNARRSSLGSSDTACARVCACAPCLRAPPAACVLCSRL